MSRMKQKADQVLAEGRASRETWTPKLGSTPLRVYRWWRRETGHYIYQENFCHFWRVVLIWAPFLRIRQMMRLNSMADKFSAPGFVKNMNDKQWGIGLIVFAFLVAMVLYSTKFWPDFGWWALLIALGCVILNVLSVITFIALVAFVVFVGEKLTGAIKRRRLPKPAPTQSVTKRVVAGARSAGRSTGEFAVLAGQVIRTKKWKVCPLVEIPPEG